jgi:hypothetical protein
MALDAIAVWELLGSRPMDCLKCRHRAQTVGLLCSDCSRAIATPIAPEQVVGLTPQDSGAALVDQWGRPHAIGAHTHIGRTVERGISIFDVSVSRHHASITCVRGRWTLCDTGSSNGTFLNRRTVTECVLTHGDQIDVGNVGFYAMFDIGPVASFPPPVVSTCVAPKTSAPVAGLRILEPTGGNGGLVQVENMTAQLSATQLELVTILSRRMRQEAHVPLTVRGFVRSSELVGALSWDARAPDDTHVKQLVRRVRRALVRSGLGDIIESRHRLGYRLRVQSNAA